MVRFYKVPFVRNGLQRVVSPLKTAAMQGVFGAARVSQVAELRVFRRCHAQGVVRGGDVQTSSYVLKTNVSWSYKKSICCVASRIEAEPKTRAGAFGSEVSQKYPFLNTEETKVVLRLVDSCALEVRFRGS